MSSQFDVFIKGEGGQNWHILRDVSAESTIAPPFWVSMCGTGEGNREYSVRLGHVAEDGTASFMSYPDVEVPLDVCPACSGLLKK